MIASAISRSHWPPLAFDGVSITAGPDSLQASAIS
jgi:hypothetical protein